MTGASGFLGAHLCRRLAEEGAAVHGTSRSPRDAPPTWWQPDLEDVESVRALFAEVRPRVVYHLAGRVSAAPDRDLVLPLFHSLLTSTVHVLLAASESGCRRVVLAGSLTEPEAPGEAPASPYAAAKQAGTGYAKLFDALYDVSVVITRPFMTYGPGQHPSKVVPYVAASLLRGESPALSSGRQEADWIYVDDVVEGLVRAGSAEGLGGREVDLGTGRLTSLRRVIETVASLLDTDAEPRFGAREERPLERARVARLEEASALLEGWRPRIGLEEGLRRTVAAVGEGRS